MGKIEELRERRKKTDVNLNNIIDNMQTIENESIRVADVAANAQSVIYDLDVQFEKKTGLTKTDIAFLFFATGLQMVRQYVLTNFKERLDDKKASQSAKNGKLNEILKKNKSKQEQVTETLGIGDSINGQIKGGNCKGGDCKGKIFNIKDKGEHSNRKHRYYNPSLDEIITNPVPFDANIGANGALTGGGHFGHRGATLGHDPLLGLIFGTANIATSTITNNKFQSYHVKTGLVAGRNGMNNRDVFGAKASTKKVMYYTLDKLFNQGMEGKKIVICSFLKEIIHLQSDVNSVKSLPLPLLSVLDMDMATDLAKYGVDMANIRQVGKQASYATMINMLIAIMHRLLYDGEIEMDKKLYEVRTRKIIMYSNIIASTSNIVWVAGNVWAGNETVIRDLDIGGIIVAIHRTISDVAFIRNVKEEFVLGNFDKMIQGEELQLQEVDIWE